MNYCTKCGQPVAEGAKFCNHCGAPVNTGGTKPVCPKCGHPLEANEKFCSVCGAPVQTGKAPPAKPPTPSIPPQPEKKKKAQYTKEGRKIIDSGPKPASGPGSPPKSRPTRKPAARNSASPPAKKKKNSCLGCLGKSIIGILALLVIGIAIIYFLPDADKTSGLSENENTAGQDLYSDISTASPDQEQSAVIDAGKTGAEIGNVKVDFGPFNIDKPTKVQIGQFPEKVIKDECKITAYDIKLEGKTRFDDYFTITLPYDEDFIEEGNAYNNVAAQYFNKNTKQWEPVIFDIDTKNKTVIIQTDHLSRYGVFTVKNEKKRHAYVSGFYIPDRYFEEDQKDLHLAVIKEYYTSDISLGEKALSAGLGFWGDFSGQSGVAINAFTMGGMYSTKFIDKMSNGFKNMGYVVSALQLAYDLHRGDQKSAAINLTKNLMNQMIAELNSTSLNLASIGIFFIDYSLTKYGNAAMAERYKNLFTVYDYYNKNNNPHEKTLKEWRYFFIDKDKEYPDDPARVSGAIMEEIDAYVNSFFNETRIGTNNENTEEINALAGEAGLKHVSWPNSDDILKVKGECKQKLIDKLYPVFISLNHYRINKMKEELNKQCANEQKMMNTVVPITIMEDLDDDEEADYANYIVCLRPLSEDADKKQWTGKLNDRGYIKTSFTIIGFVLAGEPNRVEIYDPEDDPDEDDPVFTKKFVVDPDGITIILESTELADGPWETWFYEGETLYDALSSESFKHALTTAAGEAFVESGVAEWEEGAKEQQQNEQKKLDEKDKKAWLKAVDKLNKEYNSTLSAGTVSIPGGNYEIMDKNLFFHKYKPEKRGNLYIFNLPDEDGDKTIEIPVILYLKSNDYFEAKIFYKSKATVSIDYMKGKLKK